MRNQFLTYIVAAISILSLQSCVSNYVVSATPSQQDFYNKTNANVPKISKASLVSAKKSLYADDNFEAAKATLTELNKLEARAEIEKAIQHEKTIDDILNQASTYIGTPYRFGGTSRRGIDCSAFVLSVFNEATGISLPRVAAAQAQEGERVAKSELKRGDLVFFSHGRRISHVGIVQEVTEDGEVKFIHAATSRGVMISSLNDGYWGPRYRFAKRIIQEN
ncbi:C40 family peptidase [Riemerella columbina]|uniref:C40 family peptidase n=1 Tax=Riemerella columbina TaxID=103810 RepID=UPI00266F65D0|nr:NlpC/P60 family protein [Riemerella columbina]WKS95182.1 NlpC/P60 family protein [Riemerella columbina]